MSDKPKICDEPNCECTYSPGEDFSIDEPHSAWCFGVRTGIIKGKEKAIVTTPSDIFVQCLLIGNHSEANGRHCFITNIPDAYLDLRAMIFAWKHTGRLKRTFRSAFTLISDDMLVEVSDELLDIFHKIRYPHTITIGTKFIEFGCSCTELFFREYNHNHKDKYYKPNAEDRKAFNYHKRLGHTIRYRKCKRVKASKIGENPLWQDWGWHNW